MYLAWKTGRLFPTLITDQFETIQWLMFQMGGVGPFFGQVHHFLRAAPEPVPYAIERYSKETRRLYGVMDKHLQKTRISRTATIPSPTSPPTRGSRATTGTRWTSTTFPAVKRWFDQIGARPAVQAGMKVPQVVR